MTFNSFIRYLLFLRWSRLLAFVFAFVGCFIIGYYFLVKQENHRQTEWNFKNISHIHAGVFELDSGRVYEIMWDRIYGKAVVPTELLIDGEAYDTMNYFDLPAKGGYIQIVRAYVNYTLTNPTRIRLKKSIHLGIIFRVYTQLNVNESPGDLFGKWFDSWFDPVASVTWSVHDITDSYNNETIDIDGKIPIIQNYR